MVAPPEVPVVLRRSRRLSILNELKLAREEEEYAKNVFETPLHRVQPSYSGLGKRNVFGDVTKKAANATNTGSFSDPKPLIIPIGDGYD